MTTDDPQITFRRAAPEDAETIAAITEAAYTKYVPRIGRKPQPMTADYRQMAAEHPIWLLCLDGQPVGVLALMEEPETLFIYNVAVHPQHQHQGLGRRLLAWAEELARQSGRRWMRLYTNERMVENLALYLRLGYVETRREPYLGTDLVHMAKEIEGGLPRED